MSVTLSWLLPGYDDPKDSRSWHEETFVHERDATLRAIELYDAPTGEVFAGPGIYLDGTLLSRASFVARRWDSERRREAVALELLCQSNGIYTDRHLRIPNLKMAALVMAENPMLARGMFERTDRLIAAYEGALQ